MITLSIIPDCNVSLCFLIWIFCSTAALCRQCLSHLFLICLSFEGSDTVIKGRKWNFPLSQAKIHIIRKQKMANDRGFDALLYPRAWAGQEKQLSKCFFLSCALIIDTEMLSEDGIIFIWPKIKRNWLSELLKGSLVHCVCKGKRSKNKSLAKRQEVCFFLSLSHIVSIF